MALEKKNLPIKKTATPITAKKPLNPKAKVDTTKPADSKVVAALRWGAL
jgi:hypothetical protein